MANIVIPNVGTNIKQKENLQADCAVDNCDNQYMWLSCKSIQEHIAVWKDLPTFPRNKTYDDDYEEEDDEDYEHSTD